MPSRAAALASALLAASCAPAPVLTPPPTPTLTPPPTLAPPPTPTLTPTPTPTSSLSSAACAVWDRENSFSRSVRDHDARAFAEHVLPHAAFISGPNEVLRGRDAVVAGWADVIRGEAVKLEWHPTSVEPASDSVVLSRGPFWVEIAKPGAPTKWVQGIFQSTWVRDADGVWRVAFDGGTAPPVPTTEAEIAVIKAAIPSRGPGCPA